MIARISLRASWCAVPERNYRGFPGTGPPGAPRHHEGGQRRTKGLPRHPKWGQSRQQRRQKEPNGIPEEPKAPPWYPKREFKGYLYTQKLPISRTGGRNVIRCADQWRSPRACSPRGDPKGSFQARIRSYCLLGLLTVGYLNHCVAPSRAGCMLPSHRWPQCYPMCRTMEISAAPAAAMLSDVQNNGLLEQSMLHWLAKDLRVPADTCCLPACNDLNKMCVPRLTPPKMTTGQGREGIV